MLHAAVLCGEVLDAGEQILESQQSAYLFVKRILVADHAVIAVWIVVGILVANDILEAVMPSIAVFKITLVEGGNLCGETAHIPFVDDDVVS